MATEFKSKSDMIAEDIAYKSVWQSKTDRDEEEIRMTPEELAGAYLQMHSDAALEEWKRIPADVIRRCYPPEVFAEVSRLLGAALDPNNY